MKKIKEKIERGKREARERIAMILYRVMELLDGEVKIKLIPYRIAQPIKLKILATLI